MKCGVNAQAVLQRRYHRQFGQSERPCLALSIDKGGRERI